MRDQNRINRIMSKLTMIWQYYPDLRFFQLCAILKNKFSLNEDLFYYEDTHLEKMLDIFIEENFKEQKNE